MNTPKNHHYVPESYLQFFSFNDVGDLFTYKPKHKYQNVIRQYNKSAICYSDNLYKLDKLRYKDEYLIEKEKFQYEKTFIKNIITKINHLESLNNAEYVELVKMILNIKNRNIIHYDQFLPFSNANINNVIEDFSINLKKQVNEKYNSFIDDIFSIAKEKVSENLQEQSLSNMILNESFLQIIEQKNNNFKNFESWIVNKKYKIFYTDDKNCFITNDNPGHTIHKNGIIGNLYFGSAKAFFFPLSPNCAIFIDVMDAILGGDMKTATTNYEKLNPEFVNMFNKGTVQNCNQMIISNSKQVLSKYIKKGPEPASGA